ncbi:MAG: sulfite exporter TauE/SafE family protein [Patescibacteria group bacterium]
MNLFVIFLTGLTIGGLTCLAVQGGLLASIIATREEELTKNRKWHAIYATVIFLITKLIAYTILGFLLGAFGGAINIGGKLQTLMQLFAGIYMVIVALNLLNIHPIFRYAIIQPPRFLTRLVRNQSKSKDIFAPAFLGAMTVFIPCGTTIAMEALAISSASGVNGALIMFSFILGTIPLFFGIGFLTSILGDTFKTKFFKLAAVLVIFLGITSINGALVAFGSPISLNSATKGFNNLFLQKQSGPKVNYITTQNPQITITSSGYYPNYIRVKKDQLVTITLVGRDAFSCASAFRIPSLGISVNLQSANDIQRVTFIPRKTGEIIFTCSMGMYSGVIDVL